MANNLSISKNFDFSTTIDELIEAQEKGQMLAEQDIKAEKIKDEKNTLEYFICSTSTRAVETRKGERGKNKALETQQTSAEQDIKVEQNKEKRHSHGKLLYPIIDTNKDENTRALATKPLLTCIADYRSIADSLAPSQKQEVNDECNKAEQWLNDHSQQHSFPNNVDPILWASIIKYTMESFERRCEHIMNYKPSSQTDVPTGMQVD